MNDPHPIYDPGDPAAVACYHRAIRALKGAGVEFLIGGAYALARYTGIIRHTKDLDVFLRPRDRDAALTALAGAGFRTEIVYTHWLAKAYRGDYFLDLIHNSGNGIAPVDDGWFEHATEGEVVGEPIRLCPAEEGIWSKAFVMERNRYDGADIHHILRSHGDRLDWDRLLKRFGDHWSVLFAHLVLFGYSYPAERDQVPARVMRELTDRLRNELDESAPAEKVCRGTLLAAIQYLADVDEWGYEDARVAPHGTMTREQVDAWTEGILTGR
jgi:hypothetical protein